MDKILFICEGEKTEKKFCDFIIDKYFIQNHKNKEYVAFKTNIYGLYDEMSRDEGLDIIQLIKERAKTKKDMITYNKLDNGGFSEVYLIFDYDFQANQYDYKKLMAMLDFFDNETLHGKLYINYPMLEAYKHFRSIPDKNYNTYQVNKSECLKYKNIVGKISVIPHFSDVTMEILNIIIKQSLDKYAFISKNKIDDYASYLENFSQKKLLELQTKYYKKSEKIYVLNTSLFWGVDYFGKPKFDEYNNIKIIFE